MCSSQHSPPVQRQAEHRQKCLEFKKSFIFLNDRKEGRVQKWCWMLSPEAVASEGSVRVEHGSSQCWLGSVARANSEVQQQEVWDSSVSSRSEGSQLWHASGESIPVYFPSLVEAPFNSLYFSQRGRGAMVIILHQPCFILLLHPVAICSPVVYNSSAEMALSIQHHSSVWSLSMYSGGLPSQNV